MTLNIGNITIAFLLLFFAVGCGPQRKPFEGVASLPCAPSLVPLLAVCVNDFENQYPKARINLSRRNCRDAMDSLLNGVTEQIVLDRPLTKPESLAFQAKKKPLYVFRLARMPMAFVVNTANPVTDLDSMQLAAILTGRYTDWNQVGERSSTPIRLILPPTGEGVWELLQVLFKTPQTIVAEVTTPDSIALKVARDPAALGALAGVAPDFVRPLGIRFDGKSQKPTLRAIYEGRYPWVLPVAYLTTKEEIDVATSFLNYITSNQGQRLLADNGVLPAMVPLRIVDAKPTAK